MLNAWHCVAENAELQDAPGSWWRRVCALYRWVSLRSAVVNLRLCSHETKISLAPKTDDYTNSNSFLVLVG